MKAVDTTGAGDAHAGVFIAGLADGLSPARAAARANAAAAFVRHPPRARDVADPGRPGRVAGGEARVVRDYVVSAW